MGTLVVSIILIGIITAIIIKAANDKKKGKGCGGCRGCTQAGICGEYVVCDSFDL